MIGLHILIISLTSCRTKYVQKSTTNWKFIFTSFFIVLYKQTVYSRAGKYPIFTLVKYIFDNH
nr:MAG TPA: hypothetical protein [Bacteriophage sp.]